jgi:hypothetical protein
VKLRIEIDIFDPDGKPTAILQYSVQKILGTLTQYIGQLYEKVVTGLLGNPNQETGSLGLSNVRDVAQIWQWKVHH